VRTPETETAEKIHTRGAMRQKSCKWFYLSRSSYTILTLFCLSKISCCSEGKKNFIPQKIVQDILTFFPSPQKSNDWFLSLTSVCFHNSKEEADIDRTEIANATAILVKLLKDQNYDTNARPGAGKGNAIGHPCVTL